MKSSRYPLLLALLFVVHHHASGQNVIHARTEAGKDVILYPDGTWKNAAEATTPKSGSDYTRPSSARASYKTERGEFVIWYDETKWRLAQRRTDEDIVHFGLVHTDGYAMIVTDGLQIPTEGLQEIALSNAKGAAPDAKIASEEMRVINGKKVLCLVIEGTIQQIPFTYYGYYYGGKQGTIQLITFTGQSLFPKYKKEFTDFLNGLEIKD